MDDYVINRLSEGQYEWALKLVKVLSPYVNEGIQSMFKEAIRICDETNESNKYLMTLQNFLARVPNWNNEIIKKECDRIVEKSGCTYIDDLISCVHITHLKILASIKPGKTQKKIDIDIPKMHDFIHKVYVNCSREFYSNTYLFEKNVSPLVYQKNRNEMNQIIKNSILDAVRDSIPIDQLLRSYLDETTDLVFTKEKVIEPETPVEIPKDTKESIKFSDNDHAVNINKEEEVIFASKDVDHLEEISTLRYNERKLNELDDSDDENQPLVFSNEPSDITLDISDLTPDPIIEEPEVSIDDLLVNL